MKILLVSALLGFILGVSAPRAEAKNWIQIAPQRVTCTTDADCEAKWKALGCKPVKVNESRCFFDDARNDK